jgi:hypothetical protein
MMPGTMNIKKNKICLSACKIICNFMVCLWSKRLCFRVQNTQYVMFFMYDESSVCIRVTDWKHWTNYHEILYLWALPDFVHTFQFGKHCITIDTSYEHLCFSVGVLSSITYKIWIQVVFICLVVVEVYVVMWHVEVPCMFLWHDVMSFDR